MEAKISLTRCRKVFAIREKRYSNIVDGKTWDRMSHAWDSSNFSLVGI